MTTIVRQILDALFSYREMPRRAMYRPANGIHTDILQMAHAKMLLLDECRLYDSESLFTFSSS